MHPSTKTAAFFDLDKTLLAKSSGGLYIRVLRERGWPAVRFHRTLGQVDTSL